MKVCNTCLKVLHCENEYFTLDDETNDFISIRTKLMFCVPEMDLGVFQYSIICIPCSEVLSLAYDFKNNCLRSEQKVRDYNAYEEDSKIDIKPTVIEESCLPLANITIKNDLSFTIEEPSGSEFGFVSFENHENGILQNDTAINSQKFQQKKMDKLLLRDQNESNVKDESFKCENCKQDFVIKMVLNNPDEKIRFYCGLCQKTNASQQDFSDTKQFHCDICYKKFRLKRSLKTHLINHTGEKPFCCNICHKSFTCKDTIRRHIRLHTSVKLFTCDICKKSFKTNQTLQQHIICHTGEKPFCCDVCQKQFRLKRLLKIHLVSHTSEKPFCCNICQKGFASKENLKRHIVYHTVEKLFCCNVCEKSFRFKRSLNIHLMSHTGEKPFHCTICQKRFSYKVYLKEHMVTHSDQKPFCCTICQKSFAYKRYLKDHLIRHNDEKPFCCHICQKSFRRKRYLKNHLISHTSKK